MPASRCLTLTAAMRPGACRRSGCCSCCFCCCCCFHRCGCFSRCGRFQRKALQFSHIQQNCKHCVFKSYAAISRTRDPAACPTAALHLLPSAGHTVATQSQRSHSSHCHCHASPRSIMLRIDSICLLLSLLACSVRPLVMPHSATSSARGEDIRTTSS